MGKAPAMSGGLHLILVDGDTRRRATISHGLRHERTHVEPFEDSAELIAHWPQGGLLLIHDDGDTISAVVDYMTGSGKWLPVIAFAESPSTRQVVRAMQAGVLDYLAWPFAEGELDETLMAAQERGQALTSAKLREAMARARIEPLSQREREVLTGMASGLSNELIARKLDISPRTVEIHRANMLGKIGAKHSSEAIRVAIEASLLD